MRLKKSPSQNRAQETVARIMEAAGAVMMEIGIAGLTIRKVAAKAGLGVGSIYDYFPDKQTLLEAVCEKRLQSRLQIFEDNLLQQTGTGLLEELQSYRTSIEKADLTSRLGLALRSASEQNSGLRKIVKRYEVKFTKGMSAFLQKHLPNMPEDERDALATYIMHIDYMTMALMHQSSDAENIHFRRLQSAVKYYLLSEAGIEALEEPSEAVNKSVL